MLARAQGELLHGSAQTALALTDEHARTYPHGTLAQEREMIAIEALAKMGQMPKARSRALVFRKAYPASTYGARLDALLGP